MAKFYRVLLLGSFFALGIGGPAASQTRADVEQCRQCAMSNLTKSCTYIVDTTVKGTVAGAMTYTPQGFACGFLGGFVTGCVLAVMHQGSCDAICRKSEAYLRSLPQGTCPFH